MHLQQYHSATHANRIDSKLLLIHPNLPYSVATLLFQHLFQVSHDKVICKEHLCDQLYKKKLQLRDYVYLTKPSLRDIDFSSAPSLLATCRNSRTYS